MGVRRIVEPRRPSRRVNFPRGEKFTCRQKAISFPLGTHSIMIAFATIQTVTNFLLFQFFHKILWKTSLLPRSTRPLS